MFRRNRLFDGPCGKEQPASAVTDLGIAALRLGQYVTNLGARRCERLRPSGPRPRRILGRVRVDEAPALGIGEARANADTDIGTLRFHFTMPEAQVRALAREQIAARLPVAGAAALMALVVACIGLQVGVVEPFPAPNTTWVVTGLLLAGVLMLGNWALQFGAARLAAGSLLDQRGLFVDRFLAEMFCQHVIDHRAVLVALGLAVNVDDGGDR